MRRMDAIQRDSKVVKWNGKPIGNITSWNGNASCVCKMHPGCRSPVSRTWGSDQVLEDWLLLSVKASGEVRIDKNVHQQHKCRYCGEEPCPEMRRTRN